jgi:hypothetical protein
LLAVKSDTIPTVFSSFIAAWAPKTGAPTVSPALPRPEADHTVDDGKIVGMVSRF